MGKVFTKKGHLRKKRQKDEESPLENQKAKKKFILLRNLLIEDQIAKEGPHFFLQRAACGLKASLCPMPSSVIHSHFKIQLTINYIMIAAVKLRSNAVNAPCYI